MNATEPGAATIPAFPETFSDDQLDKLRALTRYAIGCSSRALVFPDIADTKKRNLSTELQMSTRLKAVRALYGDKNPLSKDDVDNFKRGFSLHSIGSASVRDREKLLRIYSFIYLYLSEGSLSHSAVASLKNAAYAPRVQHNIDRFEAISAAIQNHLSLSGPEIAKHATSLRGVYYLYRYGTSGDLKSPELVRSIVRITLITTGNNTRLRVSIAYKAGDQKKKGTIQRIESIALPQRSNLFVTGTDGGVGSTPCLIITKLPSHERREPQLTGLLLRCNTLGHTAATRIVLVRKTGVDDESSQESIDRVFYDHQDRADLLALEEVKDDPEISGILDLIDNKVTGTNPAVPVMNDFMLTGL